MSAPSTVFSAFRRLPIVIILGATGTGKSKLAIEIGRQLNGEIISADAMQLYRGLDIVTNKVTEEEQSQCPHHMIGYVDPHSFYTVTDFRNKAVPIIDGLLQRGKLPVIVGGTNYYIEALLWNILIGEEKDTDTLVWDERPLKKLKVRKRDVEDNSGEQQSLHDIKIVGASLPGATRQDAADKGHYVQCQKTSQDKVSDPCSSDTSAGRLEVKEKSQKSDFASGQDVDVVRTCSSAGTSSVEGDIKEGSNEQRTDLRPSSVKDDPGYSCKHSNEDKDIDLHQDSPLENITTLEDRTLLSSRTKSPDVKTSSATLASEEQNVQYEDLDVDAADNATLHSLLSQIDPERAKSLHPNNRRKIIRSLQVFEQQGISHSELLARQHQQSGASSLSGPVRYPNICILWLQAETEVLRQRLDDRVDDMMTRGLVKELADFHRQYNEKRLEAADIRKDEQYVNGIFQSIGFKEFHEYLILSDEDKKTAGGMKLLEEGIERMKIGTRQYARRQNKWVRNRFVKRPGSTAPPVYSLETTDPSKWNEIVLQPALNILDHLMQGKTPPVEPVQYEPPVEEENKNTTYVCDVCQGKIIVGWNQWQGHIKSRSHAKRKRKVAMRNWERDHMLQKNQEKEEGDQPTEKSSVPISVSS